VPRLGDFLGLLLAEVSNARMQADLEAVRIGELYSSHPLLRSMPIPRVRLPELTVDVPLMIGDVEEPRPDESPRGGIPRAVRSEHLLAVLRRHFSQAGMDLTDSELDSLREPLAQSLEGSDVPIDVDIDTNRVADGFVDSAIKSISEIRRSPGNARPMLPEAALKNLRSAMRLEMVSLRTRPPRLNVIVTASELSAAAMAENVTRLRLTIAEQGLEWATFESEGRTRTRLVPE
jgi:hypothetical protein